MAATRVESDSFGPIEVPAHALWGAQTQRSLHFFAIGEQRLPRPLVHALAQVKRAAALVNAELGLLEPAKAQAIAEAALQVAAGEHDAQFPLSMWQTGSGTQSHMNVNEVLANLASLALGGGRFAIYEHLIPGSLRVKTGDRVRKGRVIGQLGFSGDSTGPHLHLHVADAARPLRGEGVGYGLERFILLGRYEDLGRLGSAPWAPLAGQDAERRDELPGSNVVVRFPE